MAEKVIKKMSPEKKNTVGNWLAVVVVILSILIPVGFYVGSNVLMWFFIVMNFVFGPACFIFYLREVKRGVFANNDDDE